MPLTEKGARILAEMKEKYGDEKGEEVFYASVNKGTITGVHPKGWKKKKGKGKAHKAAEGAVVRARDLVLEGLEEG